MLQMNKIQSNVLKLDQGLLTLCVPAVPLIRPSGRWGQTLCPIDAQTAILIGGQGAKMQFCKDPMWKLCMGGSTVNNLQKRLFVSDRGLTLFSVH